ncbi:hypothetical protein RRG08_017939 [Elysia crispata]|uniref:Uncharacterized protein n=1 Tax=Elysia crispata TaxID=231223 RepID=A0AAE0Y3B2_9GAST|nr:hypothetical protein RRG08_017939 [Elysia crispata]
MARPLATPAMVHHVTAHAVLQSLGVAALKVVVVNSERNFLHIEMPGIVKMVAIAGALRDRIHPHCAPYVRDDSPQTFLFLIHALSPRSPSFRDTSGRVVIGFSGLENNFFSCHLQQAEETLIAN